MHRRSRHLYDRRFRQRRILQKFHDLQSGQLAHLFVSQIGFGEGNDSVLDSKHPHDVEMLARLRHDATVGGHHQQHEVDAINARHHGSYKIFVTRNIHNAQ